MEADEELATYIAEAVWDRLEAVEAARPCKTEREVGSPNLGDEKIPIRLDGS